MEDRIAAIEDEIEADLGGLIDPEEIDRSGKILTSGFIDCHVYILGGGGKRDFSTRTPEITLSTLTSTGAANVMGTLGTDGICRDINAPLVRARGLGKEGVSSYIYTRAYQILTPGLTGDVMKDITAIDKVIGIGGIALSDHRFGQLTLEELVRLAASV